MLQLLFSCSCEGKNRKLSNLASAPVYSQWSLSMYIRIIVRRTTFSLFSWVLVQSTLNSLLTPSRRLYCSSSCQLQWCPSAILAFWSAPAMAARLPLMTGRSNFCWLRRQCFFYIKVASPVPLWYVSFYNCRSPLSLLAAGVRYCVSVVKGYLLQLSHRSLHSIMSEDSWCLFLIAASLYSISYRF